MRLRNALYTTVVVTAFLLVLVLVVFLARLMWWADAAICIPVVVLAVGWVLHDVWVDVLGGPTYQFIDRERGHHAL